MERIWKKIIINNIETFYSVSNYGEVRNDSTKTLLLGNISKNGYRMVHLRYRIDKMCSVHRLVMKAFKPCENMDNLQVNHIDGDKTNNRLDNLEWSTALENMQHSYKMKLQKREMMPCYQYDLEGKFIKSFINAHVAAKELNIDYTNIWRCVTEQQNHYKIWQFKKYKKDKIAPWHNTKANAVYLYNDKGEFIKKFNSQKDCAKELGLTESSVSTFMNSSKTLQGFVFSRIPL